MLNGLPRQMCVQRFALGSGFLRVRQFRFGNGFGFLWRGSLVAWPLGAHTFDFFQRQLKGRDRFVQLFGATTERHAPQLGDHELEVFNLCLLCADPYFE